MANISILGGGSWGIALAALLHKNGHKICIWSALEDEIKMLETNHEHKMLPGVKLADDIILTTNEKDAVEGKDLLVMAVATSFTRRVSKRISSYVTDGQIIVNVSKGIESDTLMRMSQVIEQEIPQADVAVLSGPTHAEEVSKGLPTTIVVGAKSQKTAEYIQNLFMNEVFRVYISPDMLGMEIGGALKNVVALAAGIADGLGCGDNTKAALITRGIAEISRLGATMGGNIHTFHGLTGIGDLIVTCASMHSRNRRAGILIGQGKTCDEAMKEVQMVVEGVYSAKAATELSKKYNVQLPIIEQVNKVLFEGKSAEQAVTDLMIRDKKIEISDLPWMNENKEKDSTLKQVMLLGDSLRMGYEPIVRRLLEGKAQVSGPNENGRWAGYTLNSFRFWIPSMPKPDIIHWNNGLWDLGDDYHLGRPFSLPEEYESSLERMVSVIKKTFPEAKIIMATTMPTDNPDTTGIEEYNEILKKVAKKHNILVNDLFPIVKNNVALVGPDHIHLIPEGFEIVGKQVAEVIESQL